MQMTVRILEYQNKECPDFDDNHLISKLGCGWAVRQDDERTFLIHLFSLYVHLGAVYFVSDGLEGLPGARGVRSCAPRTVDRVMLEGGPCL